MKRGRGTMSRGGSMRGDKSIWDTDAAESISFLVAYTLVARSLLEFRSRGRDRHA